jgi:hypothetical protein
MLHTLRFSLQNAVYFIMLSFFFWFLYYSHFTYRVCSNLYVKLRCQRVNKLQALLLSFFSTRSEIRITNKQTTTTAVHGAQEWKREYERRVA